uniref:Uncharacterized protein n=1 Tax=Anguilla anguilla TaxID=7936 RepID=A0A0E9PYN4_ANGAN
MKITFQAIIISHSVHTGKFCVYPIGSQNITQQAH